MLFSNKNIKITNVIFEKLILIYSKGVMRKIIFVCHGNICRSIAAEVIMKNIVKNQGIAMDFDIISRATSLEEIGNDIYPPMKIELLKHGYKLESHSAKRITQEDYNWADEIYYMDENNLRYLNRLMVDKDSKFQPISKYTKDVLEIEDPWYTDRYDLVVKQITKCINDIIVNKQN